jgi:hypothetical protein
VAGQGGRQRPVVLHSIDGVDWTPEPISSGLSAYPSSLTAVGDRVIGVGAAETGRCAHPFAIDTWARSPAGTWREAPWADQLCAGREFASVVLSSDGIHLVGTGNGDAPLSWTSPDGVNWTNDRPDVGEFAARTAVADGHEVLVFGLNGSGPPGLVATTDGHAFAARPFAVVPADGFPLALIWDASGLQAFLASGERLLVVTRDPTGTWTSAIASGVRGDLIASITTVDGGLVALGGDDARPVLGWTSADGHTWQSLGLPIAGPGAGVSDVATHDGVAVIVGTTDSPDGLETFGTIWSGSSVLLGLPH